MSNQVLVAVKPALNIPLEGIENAVIEIDGKPYLLKELFKIEARQTVFGTVRVTMTKDGAQ